MPPNRPPIPKTADTASPALRRWLEHLEDGSHMLTNSVKRLYDGESFIEDYLSGQAGIEFHIGIRSRGANQDTDYFLIRSWVRVSCQEHVSHKSVRGHAVAQSAIAKPTGVREVKDCLTLSKIGHVKPPVLICIGQIGENGEGIPLTRLNGVERLEPFQSRSVFGGHVPSIRVTRPLNRVGHDGELNISDNFPFLWLDSVKEAEGQLPGKIVQRGTETVNSVPDNQAPVWRDLYDALNAPYDHPIFSVVLSPDRNHFWIGITGFFNLSSQSVDVAYRMFELCPGV